MDIPVISRLYFTGAFLTTAGCALDLISPFSLYFNYDLIFHQGQLWRLITTYLFFGMFSIDFLFHMYFLVSSLIIDTIWLCPALGIILGTGSNLCWNYFLGTILSVTGRGRLSGETCTFRYDDPIWGGIHDCCGTLRQCALPGKFPIFYDGICLGETQWRYANELPGSIHI